MKILDTVPNTLPTYNLVLKGFLSNTLGTNFYRHFTDTETKVEYVVQGHTASEGSEPEF